MGEWHIKTEGHGGFSVYYKAAGMETVQLGQTPPEFTQMRAIVNWVFSMKLPNDVVYVDGKLQNEPPNN
jgi:hypothetical protein